WHIGVEGNEKADELARNGSLSAFEGPEVLLGNYAGMLSELIKGEIRRKHQLRWEKLQTCRQAKEMVEECNKQTTKFLLGLKRKHLRKMIGVLTGHNSLKYHLNKMRLTDTSSCRGVGASRRLRNILCVSVPR